LISGKILIEIEFFLGLWYHFFNLKPFFYAQHRTIPGTCRFRDHIWGAEDGAGDCRRVLLDCPEAVAFFGHTHSSLTDEQSAWQGAFTAINAGAFSNAARAAAAGPPPQFPEGATLSFEEIPDGVNRSGEKTPQIRVRFPRAETAPGGLRVFDYRVRVETLAPGEPRLIAERRVLSPGINLPEALDVEPPFCVFALEELAMPGPLRFTVEPLDGWGNAGKAVKGIAPLSARVTTESDREKIALRMAGREPFHRAAILRSHSPNIRS